MSNKPWDNDRAIRLYNADGVHILSLVKRHEREGLGYDMVKPDYPGTDAGDFIQVGVDIWMAEYIAKASEWIRSPAAKRAEQEEKEERAKRNA